jgi:LmbE family N-acetylglucosaminyl deacetylase
MFACPLLFMKQEQKNKHIIVFTAHPDDHLCAAGTLMLLREKGFTIHECVATEGEKGIWWDDRGIKKTNVDRKKLAQRRKEEITEASKLVGIGKTTFLGFADSEVTRIYSAVETVLRMVREERPDIVIT